MVRHSETLARVPLFRTLNVEQVNRLDMSCTWRHWPLESEIVSYEDSGHDVYFVISGVLRVQVHRPDGKFIILRTIGAGEWFGELAAIDGGPRSASVVAVTNSVVARMPAKVFRNAIHSYPDVCDQILTLLTGQVRMLANRVIEVSTLDAPSRIRAELLRLARPIPERAGEAKISPPPYQAEIAARVGVRREAVSRELNALERQGLILRRRTAIVIKDIDLLSEKIGQV